MIIGIIIIICLLIGTVIYYTRVHSKNISLEQNSVYGSQDDALKTQLDNTIQELEKTRAALSKSQQEVVRYQAKAEETTKQVEYLKQQIDKLQQTEAEQRTLQEQRTRQAEQEESKILQALSPVSSNLDLLRQKVEEIENHRQDERGQLHERLQNLGQQEQLLSQETTKLASVLRNNKQRGYWGEVQLKNIVEASGLTEHVDFDTQVSVSDTHGGMDRPDMVIHLPGKKIIPVDAKAPFTAYENAQSVPLTSDDHDTQYNRFLAEHARNLKSHIDELAKRAYWEDFDISTDFVIAFIPNEAWLSAALEYDSSLLDYAFSKRVALCSPVSLWAVLKSVSFSWQQQSLTEDAKQLFDICNRIYKGFGTFGKYMSTLGSQITKTVQAYDKVVGNVQGTILPQARKLKRLNPDDIAPVDFIDSDKGNIKEISAPELLSDADNSVIE